MTDRKVNILLAARDAASGPIGRVRGALGDLEKTSGGIRGKLGSVGGTLVDVGKFAVLGLGGLAAGAALAGPGITAMAGKLEQMGAKAKTVFGDSLGQVKAWASANAAAMGLTANQATGLAANFGDLLVPMGFARDEAAKMATDVVGLAGALSQWSGGQYDSAQVADILAKAMLGERDALKGLGISITEADVAARLAANGQDKLTGAALEQAKAVATQQLIFEKSKDAQAAFAQSSDGLLGKQAQLGAMFGNVTESLVTGLTPVLHQVFDFVLGTAVPAISQVVERIQAWIAQNQPLIKQLVGFAKGVLGTVVSAIANVVGWIANLIGKVASNREAMNGLRAAIGFVATAFGVVSTAVGTVVGAIGGFIDGLTKDKTVIAIFRGIVDGLAAGFRAARDAIGWVSDKIGTFIKLVKDAITWVSKLGDIKLPFGLPGFASGGPILAGHAAIVGEKGRELFIPRTDGLIVPNQATEGILSASTRSQMGLVGGGGVGGGSREGVTIHTHVNLDGKKIAEIVDYWLYFPLQRAAPTTAW